ncbi:MAG: dihydrofolate reductase [Bauldia sp.]
MGGIRLSLIAAVAENGVIGRGDGLPWRLASDLKRFRRITMGKPVVMGRRTFESIGKALAGRTNIVVTRRAGFAADGVGIAGSLDDALAKARRQAEHDGVDEVVVIGGAEIYRAALPLAERLYITHVAGAPDGDARFPAIDPALWRAVSREGVAAGEGDSAATTFVVYERVGGKGVG